MNDILLFPEDIQRKIQSYLYFSYELYIKIRIVNEIILNYTSYLMKEIVRIFHVRLGTLYFRMHHFLTHHESIYKKIQKELNIFFYFPFYPVIDYSSYDVLYYVEDVLNQMNILERQKFYNAIMKYASFF